MTKLDWEKNKRNQRNRPGPRKRKAGSPDRQWALTKFVVTHDLKCFACDTVKVEWAKTGISKRGPWALCADCARTKKRL